MGDPLGQPAGRPDDPLREQLSAHFSGLRLREDGPYGQVYVGCDDTGTEVTVAVLAAAAADDPRLRNAFADAVWHHSVGSVPDRPTVHSADLHAPRPWAATRNPPDGAGAEQLLAGLPELPPSGQEAAPYAGPAYPPAAGQPGWGYQPDPGYPAPYPAAGHSPGHPPGGLAPPPGARGTPWPWLLSAGAAAVSLVLVAVLAVVMVQLVQGEDPDPPPGADPTNGQPTGVADPSGEPTLRAVPQVSVLGPTFAPAENTFTMAFDGWPFAFRTPRLWSCGESDWDDFPDAEVWSCSGPDDSDQLANVLLWECATSCSEQEQQEMIDHWLDEPQRAVQPAEMPVTYYVETEQDDRGMYSVDLGHFAAGPAGGELRWLVGVYVESPPQTRDQVLKLLNEIISQST